MSRHLVGVDVQRGLKVVHCLRVFLQLVFRDAPPGEGVGEWGFAFTAALNFNFAAAAS